MLIKKIDVVNRAAEELKISGVTRGVTPEETVSFVGRLDEMSATLKEDGLDCGYLQPSEYGGSNPNDDSGLSIWMVRPLSVLLADDIAAKFGKAGVVSPMKINDAFDSLSNGLVEIEGSKYPDTLPMGAANEYRGNVDYFYNGNQPRE